MKNDYGRSLACQKLVKTVESQIRTHWQIQTSLIYSERWWATIKENDIPSTLAKYPGDNKSPFNSINISPSEYIRHFPFVENLNRENSIVNLITVFEVYLFDILKRIIYLHPSIMDKSEMPFEASQIGKALAQGNAKEWFANRVTDKYLRNKTHLQMLKILQSIVLIDFKKTHQAISEDWNRWTYVRNSIVHNGRETSEDLVRVWPERFSNVGTSLNLTDRDFVIVHSLVIRLSELIDQRAMISKIQLNDADLLIREIFIRDGVDNTKVLSKILYSILHIKIKPNRVDQALGFQRRSNASVEGWKFSHYNFQI